MGFTMSSFYRITFPWLLLVLAVELTVAGDILPNDLFFHDDHEGWITSFTVALVATAAVISMVIVLVACAQLCRDRFKNVQEEENYFPHMDFPNPPRDVDLGLYPPVDGTPEHGIISFEPLPDVSTLLKHKKLLRSNVARLRPKVSHVVRDRLDSEEDIDGALFRDSIQSKLDRLIAHNTKRNFERSQLNYIKEIGAGWFGKVLQGDGQGLLPGHKRTAAIIQILREDADKFDQYGFLQESAPYRDTEHPNVLKLLGHCVETTPYLTILELCINGDLKTYLRNQRSNVEIIDKQGLLLNFACDMAAGLQAMHQSNYVHRDLAIRNCLVTSDLTVKIGDYGLSEEIFKDDYYADPTGALIPIRWLAPEVITYSNGNGVTLRHITKDCNLWSFGVALWEIVTFGFLPYADLSNEQVLKLVVFEQNTRLLRPEVPVSNIHHLYQLMELCWLAPAQRPSLRELRIMLLHLQSSKDELDTYTFDQKWNQLLPRHHHHAEIHNNIATIDAQDITILPPEEDDFYHPAGVMGGRILNNFHLLHEQNAVRPPRMDSRFSELDPALLVHAGEFQSSLFSWPEFGPASNMESHLEPKQSFPANELSLQAELGAENFSSFRLTNGEDDEYSDDKDAFVFVSSPTVNSTIKSSEIDEDIRSGVLGKLPQQIHIAEVHRSPVDPQDVFSKEPLLESGVASKLANSREASSSEEGMEELNREEDMEDVAAKNSAVKRESVAEKVKVVGVAEKLSQNVRKSLNDLDGSASLDAETKIRSADRLTNSSVSRTEEIQTSLSSDFSFVDKPKTRVELNGEGENNNTVMVQDLLISVPGQLSSVQDQTQN